MKRLTFSTPTRRPDLEPAPAFTFEKLLQPIAVQRFLETIWGQRQFVIARNNPEYYKTLFSFTDIDHLIFLARERPQELLTIIPKTKIGTETKARLNQFAVHELYRRFDAGDTIRVSSLEGSWPPLLSLIQSISQILSARIDVNVYLTPADSQGFPTHVDHEDVFILQVGGSKEWFVYEADYPWPLENLSYVDEQGGFSTARRDASLLRLAEHVVLETGDFLYIPRGYPHHAVTSGRPSLHLTIGIHSIYWFDLARAALEIACGEEPALRRAVPSGFGNPEEWPSIASRLEDLLKKAFEKTTSFEAAIRAVVGKRTPPLDFLPDGHFASLANAAELTLTSTIERREGIGCSIQADDRGVVVLFGLAQIRGPISIRPALEYICEHSGFKIEDLPGPLDANSKVVLVRRLVREGLLRIVML
jgi:ribosomal protein L16 Arg81 hydroxylase